MFHKIFSVTRFEQTGPFQLKVWFDDTSMQEIDFRPILKGEMFGPLRDPDVFAQVSLDPEVHTLVWPNGADFDPATLHDWNKLLPEIEAAVAKWELVPV